MGSPREDELARTATAPVTGGSASDSAAASATQGGASDRASAAGPTLGRYRLEHELGAGGMGVVHAAFDPDLERRVALKVLRVAAPSADAKDRLMREARAMARLSHPNVITVHEVGTANGRDFVAMELIHGGSLAEWLRADKRRPAAILEAFVAAGRGLAAAHAAGIVHRDFKPHNVLRSREGRIVVTDFGLAREAQGTAAVALDQTLPLGSMTVRASSPSALAGLTVTGALLGTPAYMAPEQWSGGAVTPATDQFAYCVALWEALSGERPYRGPTFDELRAQVARGPAALDASRIPRRVRRVLWRGLDPDPARRWPSMDALLARLVRAERRPGLAFGIAGGAVVAGAVAIVALRAGGTAPRLCPPPARDLATVWSPAIAGELRAKSSDAHAAALDAAFREWQTVRAQVCDAPAQVQQAQLVCLDGVLARIDALRQGYAQAPTAEDLQAELIDPAICRRPTVPEVPRLALAATPDVIAAYGLYAGSKTEHKHPGDDEIAVLAGNPKADACARVIAMLAFDASTKDVPRARSLMNQTESSVDQCADDRLRADLLITAIEYHTERPMIGPAGEAAIQRAQLAVARVKQPDLEARLAMQQTAFLRRLGRWPEMFRLADAAIEAYGARGLTAHQIDAIISRNNMRFGRCETADLEAVVADAKKWRATAEQTRQPRLRIILDIQSAAARFRLGDLANAHPDILRLWQEAVRTFGATGSRRIEGDVVDARGRPVAGATVMTARALGADSIGIGIFLGDADDSLRIATTDERGRFTIDGAAQTGVIVAQLAERRSRAAGLAERVRLVLEPTRSASGKVELGGVAPGAVLVSCDPASANPLPFYTFAPVKPDGTFTIDGVSTSAVRISALVFSASGMPDAISFQTQPASSAPITGLELSVVRTSRVLDVILRSQVAAPLSGAEIFVLAGKPSARPPKLTGDLTHHRWTAMQRFYAKRPAIDELPEAVRSKVRADDLAVHLEHAPEGELTVCGVAVGGDLGDPAVRRRNAEHEAERTVACERVAASATDVIVSVPPQRRFD
ncbi:MAG TPA: serine/threonine-protein kinase [Kofleriaceae bacterium]|nr:serine/threonine-protein kinase [Kofleriaceae bacterium]